MRGKEGENEREREGERGKEGENERERGREREFVAWRSHYIKRISRGSRGERDPTIVTAIAICAEETRFILFNQSSNLL